MCSAIFPGVDIFTTAGEQMMLSLVEFEPHAVVESHSHPHEQMGLLLDNDYGSQYWTLEASRRLGESYRILLDMQFVTDVDAEDTRLYAVRQDSFMRVELRRYF